MNDSNARSKLELSGGRTQVSARHAIDLITEIFSRVGCAADVAKTVATHLADASLCGVESHGLMRTLQYVEQFRSGYMNPRGSANFSTPRPGKHVVDGGGGIGIPAMWLAYQTASDLARAAGIAALAVTNVGHTGRHGAFAEFAAQSGVLTILVGGGNREVWRQVAPYGGASAKLPTNPYCIGIPGGARGPVVIDFATSMIAGGWIYAARSAGTQLPEGTVIASDGTPTRDPEGFFQGGAILPAAGPKGYGMALMAELIAEALIGPVETEGNWLLLAIDTGVWREAGALQMAAEEILSDIRSCPPAPGFDRVEIPGERERAFRDASNGMIGVPEQTWQQILDLAASLEVNTPE